jgi:transposase, IS5 family
VYEPSTEVILRKGKSADPRNRQDGVLQGAENQIVIDFTVYDKRLNDSDLLVPAIEIHQPTLGRALYLVAADAAFLFR